MIAKEKTVKSESDSVSVVEVVEMDLFYLEVAEAVLLSPDSPSALLAETL
jgi:hypothetical protein